MHRHTFSKEERLCSIRHIQSLFHNGSSFVIYPYRVVYQIVEDESLHPMQVLISVSKRRFKHAVTRNRLKRLTREAYRLEKPAHKLAFSTQSSSRKMRFALQFVGKEELPLTELRSRISKVLEKLQYAYDQVDLDVRH